MQKENKNRAQYMSTSFGNLGWGNNKIHSDKN